MGVILNSKEEYSVSGESVNGITEITIKGRATRTNVDNIQQDVFNMALQCRLLIIDVREITGRLPISDSYIRVRNLRKLGRPINRFTAIIDNPENYEFQKFYETTALNAGVQTKVFTDIEEGRAWLLGLLRLLSGSIN